MTLESSAGFLIQEPYGHPLAGTPTVKLSELPPGRYVDAIVRVALIKSREKEDQLGRKPYIYGVAEDSTFRVPFVCYKPYQMFFKDSVFKFENAYVHKFDDDSVLLVLTEYSRIKILPEEPPQEYLWQPKIGSIHRPLGSLRVTLEGTASNIYSSSGLVRRCEKCDRVIHEGSCRYCHEKGGYWSARISCRLSDETGSINAIFSQYLTCKLLGRAVSELLCLAEVPNNVGNNGFKMELFKVKPPEKLSINELTVVDPSFFRECEKLLVTDRKNSRIYCPQNVRIVSKHILDKRERTLNYSNEEDKTVFSKLLEKAFDLEVRSRTDLPKLHGIYLMEEPIPLYGTETAKLYLGFELEVNPTQDYVKIGFYPTGLVRESALDYVKWRRSRGASPESLRKALLKWKRNVILAPNGTVGAISNVLFKDAGSFSVPALDVPLPQFWKDTYDIDVNPEEKPLLVVKPYNVDLELTYPPSCVFFDEQSLYLKSSVQSFVEYKKRKLQNKVFRLARDVVKDLRIDGWRVETIGLGDLQVDAQRIVFNEIKGKMLGRKLKATGSIVQAGGKLYFFPKTIGGVYRS